DDDDDNSEKYNSEMDTRSNQNSEYENDKVEVDDDNDAQNMSFDKSSLPKNIEQGRAFMNNMKFSNLEFSKVLITKHKDKDYFLYYQNLIQCIKNILAIPDITQNFALSYENFE
ncbi:13787_t:CDS:2, partial [Rhizophagus irregularis]